MTLPAFAVSAGACSRYRSIAGNAAPAATRDRANLPQMHAAAAVDRRDRRTDGRTYGHPHGPLHRPRSSYYAGSVNNVGKSRKISKQCDTCRLTQRLVQQASRGTACRECCRSRMASWVALMASCMASPAHCDGWHNVSLSFRL